MSQGFLVGDAKMKASLGLPDGAATTVADGFDTQNSARGSFQADTELVIAAPALGATPLPDGQTITYQVFHDTAVGFGTETLLATLGVQTGAGGAGAAAAELRIRLPTTVKRYVRAKAVKTGAADASGSAAEVRLRF
jgi:hypothetical protein